MREDGIEKENISETGYIEGAISYFSMMYLLYRSVNLLTGNLGIDLGGEVDLLAEMHKLMAPSAAPADKKSKSASDTLTTVMPPENRTVY